MKTTYLIALIFILNISLVYGQTIDKSFHDPIPIRPAKIECIKVLSDGKILLGGDIAFFKTARVNNLIRLNSDSTLDNTFIFKGNKQLLIKEIDLQSTGDIVVLAQGYESLIGVVRDNYSVFLLAPSGEIKNKIDTLSNPQSIAVQSDDKLLVCGGNNSHGFVYRFSKDLAIDPSFNNKIKFDKQATDVVINGSIIFVSGTFSSVNDTTRNDIVKLNMNGKIDNTFHTGSGTTDAIHSLSLQADGKLLLGKTYINSFNGTQCHGMARLNPDGSVDGGFRPPLLTGPTSDITIKGTAIYVSAAYRINSSDGSYLLKLKPDGSIDEGFHPVMLDEFGFSDFCMAFALNNLFFNNSSAFGSKYGLSKSDSTGKSIKTFAPEVCRYGVINPGDYFNGKLVVSGDFISIDGTETQGVARLNGDGSVDKSFVFNKFPGIGLQIKVLNDSNLLLSTGKAFIKLNDRAVIQSDFNFSKFKTLYNVLKFRVLETGKIIAGDANNIYRLNTNGSEDTTFNIGSGISSVCTAFDFDLQNNKIIYGSNFNKFNGITVNRLVRLNPDASPDESFKIGSGPDDIVSIIKVLNSGEIIVGGFFKTFNGIQIPHGIVKLSPNGAVDLAFNENQKTSFFDGVELVNVKVEQCDSIMYIKGVAKVKVLNVNGKFDSNFSLPFEVDNINDIVAIKESSINGKGKKTGSDGSTYLFALGTFMKNGTTDPSFILKLIVGKGSTAVPEIEIKDSDFILYPVPVIDKMNITTSKQYDQPIIIVYSINGNQLYSTKMSDGKSEIDMSRYPSGFYFVKIITPGGRVITKKIIKQ